MALSISDHCRSCIVSLQEVISILSQPDRSDHHVKASQVCEELDRFSLFIGNIGALHRPESPLSIESRLQDANDVLTHIFGLLTDLNDVTAELLDIVSGKRDGMVTVADEAEEDGEVISEANELREEISETITRLFRVSILIRQAAPTDIFAKALSRNRYHFSDQFDIAHVGEKYHKLATKEYGWLRQRLGRAITQRRHYLSYVQDHREKLGGIRDHQDGADVSAAKSQAPVIKQLLDSKPMLDAESRPSFFTKATTIAAERIAPQLHVAGDSDPDEDARSYTTVSRSIDGDHESSANVRIPKLDTLRADHKNEFECPFCFRIKKFKSERLWRKHVFSDLRPYVCTFPECDAPYFGDINKWFHHGMTRHRVSYNCFLCQKVYYHEGKYLSHLRQEHEDTLDDGGTQVGIDLARKPLAQISASDCPCCSDWAGRLEERIIQTSGSAPTGILAVTPTVFKRHLAAHLEQLALFAVPIAAATDDSKDSNAAIEEDRSKRTSKSQVSALTFASLPGNLDDPSLETERDPPRIPISQTDPQSTEVKREYVPSLPSDSGANSDQESSVKSPITLEREAELKSMIKENRAALGHDHPDTLARMTELALHYQDHERWEDAQNMLSHVRDITEWTLGNAHPDTIVSIKNLVACYRDQGKLEEASVLLLQVIEMSKIAFDHDHPDTLHNMQSLAGDYVLQDRWEEAAELYAQILEIDKTRPGPKQDDALKTMESLAFVLSHQGRWDEAKRMYKRVIREYGERFGRGHQTTLQTIGVFAVMLKRQGELEEAALLQREVSVGFSRLFGPEAEITLSSKEQLASILEELAEYDEAIALRREVVIGYGNSRGSEHQYTLQGKEPLASLLEGQGDYDEAETLRREAITGYERELGPEHIQTLRSKEILASMLEKHGKLDEAKALYEELLVTSEMAFGIDAARTIEYVDQLASLQKDLGKLDEEEALRREVVQRHQRAHGHEYPRTLHALLRLVDTLIRNEKPKEAVTLYKEVIKSYNEQLGPDHPDTLLTINNLTSLLADQSKFKEMENLLREQLALQKRQNDFHHPDTVAGMEKLASLLEKDGRLKEAEGLYREIFDMRIRADLKSKASELSMATMGSMNDLVWAQEKQGNLEAAESTLKEVIAILTNERSLLWTEDHKIRIMSRLTRLLHEQGKYKEAEDMRRRRQEIEKKVKLEKQEEAEDLRRHMAKMDGEAEEDLLSGRQ
ncbi:hypothetical protein yc1106_09077 [Curvularia clavata]|uniref:C2H2-type domain-containing protein n=1 Tax=Curvularia clavata TaxID=95742 RepID=A0A9Q9DV62_CURCL|nr:hypothetical protein yc1106_09077 [Curvularia clavata]